MIFLNIKKITKWMVVFICCVVVFIGSVLSYFFIELYNIQNRHNLNIHQPVIWRDNDGILLSRDGGNTYETINLLSKDGKYIDNAPFAYCHNKLYYWSEKDKSVCIISLYDNPKWIYLKNKLPYSWDCHNIEIYNKGMILIGYVNINTPICYIYNIKLNIMHMILNARDIRANCASNVISILNNNHQIEILNENNKQILYKCRFNINHWDYDPISATLCIVNYSHIIIINHNITDDWKIPWYCYIRDIQIKNRNHQIWISVGLPYSVGQLLLIYTYNGIFIGKRLGFHLPIRRPVMNVNSSFDKLINHYKLTINMGRSNH